MKKLLQLLGIGVVGILAALLVWNAFIPIEAQPSSTLKLRDLNDVRIATTPANGAALVYSTALGRWTNGTASGSGSIGLTAFNPTQISTNGGVVSIKDGVPITNLVEVGAASFDGVVSSSSAIRSATGHFTNQVTTALLLIPNGAGSGFVLTSDGSGFGTWQALPGSSSSIINEFFSTNNYFLSGRGNTLIITQVVQFAWNTLTMSGSNVSAMNLTNSSFFKLTLTNDAFMVAPINFPGTNFGSTFQVHAIQDGTGGRTITLTNGSFVMAGSGTSSNAVPTINTNANAVTVLTFATSPHNSTKLYGVVAATGQ